MEFESGIKLGKLTLIKYLGRNKHSKKVWLCQCECGNKVERVENNLKQSIKNEKPPHCGCSPNWKGQNKRFKDITGKTFGKLTVLKMSGKDKYSHNLWLCQCECGNRTITSTSALEQGKAQSCGCIRKEILLERSTTHNKSNDSLYRVYHRMIKRCTNAINKDYNYYGGRGIEVCNEWLEDFINFYNWSIENGYRKGLTIDRINVNGNYEPSNCRWVTWEVQRNNKRNSIRVNYKGEMITLKQCAENLNVKYLFLYNQLVTKKIPLEEVIKNIGME
ncbi:TPA: hypothetical protein OL424_003040 [Clostridioides difficile]|nr:hypothetical protein [Clostridioides difficile]